MAPEPIAVIGSACRFPGDLNTPSKLWNFLSKPHDLQSQVPKDRFNVDAFHHPDGSHHGRTNARHGYFLSDIKTFDAHFFNVQAGEAESMDPQQRQLLEATYDALCSAGQTLAELKGSDTAVYVGIMTHDFELTKVGDLDAIPTYLATGAATSIASNRLSYFFDWHGPSMTIDTACSSSLVAVHHAVQQLRSGTSKIAIAAGANLMLSPLNFITESKLSMLSPTGRSRMWDAAADGYARGEGIACVVLKTLSQALADGDTIDCLIRETGVGQDGRTTGITMPSNVAQAALIRATYARAGLDLSRHEGRPQFFEAHGTGTPAGDPQEAEAISTAFFSDGTEDMQDLYVGSIKTVVGHTEGTAGIAGLLKCSLAVQNGIVPPNMLLEKLNPRVEPFCEHLRVPKEATPWPAVAEGQPRRASVNSFGFGGTNAHAIIEEYVPAASSTSACPSSTNVLPLVFSARTKRSIKANMESILSLIKTTPDINMTDLAWTLLQKRSVLPVRHAMAASSVESLCKALEAAVKDDVGLEYTPKTTEAGRILGIFTGQGAQWPAMMKQLVLHLPFVAAVIDELDAALQTLPEQYRPSWTLKEQLLLEGDASNVRLAAYSQPLCAAVQIVLVRLLSAAGVVFEVIVGHSSGEIGCAYAAGFISAGQAIRIAYLRGFTSHHASSPTGQVGGMLAVGASLEDARELVELEAFAGRVCIAACNSPDSVTLSGDMDALEEIAEILQDESKFARLLRVDKAYHSNHMLPCSEPYMTALADCGCAVADGTGTGAKWYSSVREGNIMTRADVTPQYWRDNLVSPVLFRHALEQAGLENTLDAAVEVGPHPTLQGPATNTLATVMTDPIPYTGCLQRGGDDVAAFATGLGYIWERLGALNAVNGTTLVAAMQPTPPVDISKRLPPYAWDHSRVYWSESRATKAALHGPRPHLMLGTALPSSTATTLQWRNFIRPRDHEWMQGHELQGQAVLPAAGYVVMAMEAALYIAAGKGVRVGLLEMLDLSIDKAVTFDDADSMAELTLTASVTYSDDAQIDLEFGIASCLSRESTLSLSAHGRIVVTLGEPVSLPSPGPAPPHANPVDIRLFYRELDNIGYDYSNNYRCVYSMLRSTSRASGHMAHPRLVDGANPIVLHPANLDLAFQTVMGAYSSPGDKRLRSLYVPTRVGRIALVPAVCASTLDSLEGVRYNSVNTHDGGDYLSGDMEVFDKETNAVLYSVENMHLVPLTPPSAIEDHRPFTKTVWGPLNPDKVLDIERLWATEQDKEVIPIIERAVYYFVRKFLAELTEEDRKKASVGNQRYIYWHEHVLKLARDGKHLFYKPEWEEDTEQSIDKLLQENWYHPHLRLAKLVSDNSLSTIRENKNPFIWMNENGLLTEFYTSYLTSGPTWEYGQHLVGQIAHRFQNMDILEIGISPRLTGASILAIPELGFNSYTFTDISAAFFEKAKEKFSPFLERMDFRKLDITKSPAEQGFKTHAYDMIIASSVLHATPNLTETMANARTLLKPGGHVVICEATNKHHMRVGYLFGLFADWWAGVDEGRTLDPFATREEWDAIFKKTGFSGIDSVTTDRESHLFPNTLLSTHAITPEQLRLDEPLSAPPKPQHPQLVIVGSGAALAPIMRTIRELLPSRDPLVVPSLVELAAADLQPKATYVVLSEVDSPIFDEFTEEKLAAVKRLFFGSNAGGVLWLTEDAWVSNPRQAMGIGMLRSVRLENPDVAFQCLDVDRLEDLNARFLVEQILRLEEGIPENTVWTLEPEICVVDGRPHVPRIKQDTARNHRLNSVRRPILEEVDIGTVPVVLQNTPPPVLVTGRISRPLGSPPDAASQTVHVHHATVKAIRVHGLGYFHIVTGTTVDGAVLALAKVNASIVTVPVKHTFPVENTSANTLLSSVANLVAQGVVDTPPGSSALVYSPPRFCVDAIKQVAVARSVSVHIASVDESVSQGIVLHPRDTDRAIKQKIPSGIAVLYDLSSDKHATSLGPRLACVTGCAARNSSYIFRSKAAAFAYSDALEASQLQLVAESISTPTLNIDIIASCPITKPADAQDALDAIVDWKAETKVPARVSPVDAGTLFVNNKTYLLVGLSQSMGRSIAAWIIKHGGRHVVLSSRNPETPETKWLEDMERLGGKITVLAMDASSAQSVDAGLSTLCDVHNLPPVGGLAYGPLVLKDALLNNMDLATMDMVLNSKVPGAKIFHDRFCDPEKDPLDFFVMFSSAALFGGNPGQTNYTAANAYLQALGQYRRSKGLAASTIHIGAVMGIGYLTRNSREAEFQEKSDVDTLGEAEFLTLFAEAVVSGRRVNGVDSVYAKRVIDMSETEIGSGIPALESRHKETIKFYHDPRFGNLKTPENRSDAAAAGDGKMSVKEMLAMATTMEQVRAAIIEGLSDKMRGVLHIPPEESVNAAAPLLDQGIDSLGAITVASWFSKQLLVDIPILRVLSGASIDDLAAEGASRLPPAAIPLVADAQVAAAGSHDSSTVSSFDDGASTLLSTPDEAGVPFEGVVRKAPMSLTQEYSFTRQASLPDVTISHNTIGVIMEGSLSTEKLAQAVTAAATRHDTFRTAFRPSESSPTPLLHVLSAPTWGLHAVSVASRDEAEAELAKLQKEPYDLESGETFKTALFTWSPTSHLLVLAYHRLAGDGSTTENLVAELSQLYTDAVLPPAPQYTDFAVKQRNLLSSGGMDASIAYWTGLYTPVPAPLPLLPLPGAKSARGPVSWDQHTAMSRLSAVLAFRLKERTKKLRTTPMTFYLAAYAALLSDLSKQEQVSIGLADTNRSSVADLSTMGYFANLLPLRLTSSGTFTATIESAKEAVRQALSHSVVPHDLISSRLGLDNVSPQEMTHAPLFQAVFDYRQGATESGTIGGASIVEVLASRECTPYDVVLEMSDDPTKDPLVTVKLQSSVYGEGDANVFLGRYIELLTALCKGEAV
ncbi:beta-ketoacyl synthase domain-containing protein [Colletotrichum graminicola M1.001]|uniref:Beta-ketoacyl synthase domain-containing protein n=1 Tax=Colletotrichum graminicola (strain M1.001 / M2 / FGSC 10212) TaxID=645133 RepID=E3R043_COLGM|nr:beta-ketoacyl synthase domain-containing protein [Colletotrichum graminicola M1.001]EFQ36481.1 beta-ketoacyl synthase domain-containing protein [Colletotrichum graminicola M1.001]